MRASSLLALFGAFLATPARVSFGFSVLAHQAVVDACWETSIVPALRRRFPNAGGKEVERARAFAHGGSHIADLGYFPFGNRLFTDLMHYVRSGDFIAALVEGADTPDEYAFALGALSHYLTDDVGHPEATNRVVPEIYPKLRKKYGDVVTYADDPSSHLQTEFRFDVLEVARSKRPPDLFRHAIDFEVSEAALRKAFLATYGLRLEDIFTSIDVAITTYRWAFRELIHEATGIAWELYRADIQRLDPTATAASFINDLSRSDFEKEFGKTYREPGYFAKFFAVLVKLVPNVGPLKRAVYKPLPPDARQEFASAHQHAIVRYCREVSRERAHRLTLKNENLDTGQPTRGGEYRPADDAYAALLEQLDQRDFADVPSALRTDILRFYADVHAPVPMNDDDARSRKVRRELARLEATRN